MGFVLAAQEAPIGALLVPSEFPMVYRKVDGDSWRRCMDGAEHSITSVYYVVGAHREAAVWWLY